MKRIKFLITLVILVISPIFAFAFFSNMSTSSYPSAAIDQVTCISCGDCYGVTQYWVFTESGINERATFVNCNGGDENGIVYFFNFDDKYRPDIERGISVCPTNSIFFIN